MNFVLDTNAVLYFLAGRLAEPLPDAVYYISVITEIELLSYPALTQEDEAIINAFLEDVRIVDLQADIKQSAIHFRRKYRLKLPDALIVATAYGLDASLLSNDMQLTKVAELSVRSLRLRDG